MIIIYVILLVAGLAAWGLCESSTGKAAGQGMALLGGLAIFAHILSVIGLFDPLQR